MKEQLLMDSLLMMKAMKEFVLAGYCYALASKHANTHPAGNKEDRFLRGSAYNFSGV